MNMNKYILIAAVALTFAACTNEEINTVPDGAVALQVKADIQGVQTRVSVNGNSALFTSGDKINVVAGGVTYVYTLQDNEAWSSTDPYYFQDRGTVEFRAWYADPNVELKDNVISIDTKTQNVTNGWNQWDILATPAVETDVTSPTINFTDDNAFSHVMTQVTLVFKAGSGISNLTALKGYTLKSLTTDATFSTLDCTLTPGTTTGDIAVTDIEDASGEKYECTPLILVPQTVTGTIALEVTYNGETYKTNLNAPTGGFEAGYSYTYPVTISNTGLEISNATINDWQPGYNFEDVEITVQ